MTPEQEKQYYRIENEFNEIQWDNEFRESSPSLIIMNKLRQYTSSIKLDTVKEFIQDLNEEDNKILVFDCFKKPLYDLNSKIENSSVYSGDIEPIERQRLVNEFQNTNNKDLMNLLITMQSGNFGITLTEASKIIILNQSFTPSENEQCYARAHRIGQKNSVMVYIFIYKNTIDDLIDKAIGNKQVGISKVVDGEDYLDTSNTSTLSELINFYKKIYKK
jgi:SNF2 family DNA or RNA helicase